MGVALRLGAEEAMAPAETMPPPRSASRTVAYDAATPLNPSQPKPIAVATTNAAPATTNPATATPAKMPEAKPAPKPTPAIAPKSAERAQWGVMVANTNSLDAAGTVRGKLMAGTVAQVVSVQRIGRDALIQCRLRQQNKEWTEDDGYFIPEAALRLYATPFEKAPDDQISVMTAYYGIQGKILARQDEIRAEVIRSNPHFDAYQKIAKDTIAFQERYRIAAEEAENATAAKRAGANDKMRKMKQEEAEMMRKFKQTEEKYRQWKTTHDDGTARFPADPAIRALERERAALETAMAPYK